MSPHLHLLATSWIENLARASWQGGWCIIAVWLACRVWTQMPARLRWWLWQAAFLRLLVALVWTSPVELPVLSPNTVTPIADSSRSLSAETSLAMPAGGIAVESLPPSPSSPLATNANSAPSGPEYVGFRSLLAPIWIVGAICMLIRLYAEWARARRLRRSLGVLSDAAVQAVVSELSQAMHLRRVPGLAVSDKVHGPLLLGAWSPVIVLPCEMTNGFSPARLRLALAHELAHARRRDLLWNWLPLTVHSIFYFHPLVWLATREWRLAREVACDEEALLVAQARPAEYAAMLADVVEFGSIHPGVATETFSMGVSDAGKTVKTLKRRINAMKHVRPQTPLRAARLAALILAAVCAAVVPLRLVAQRAPAPRPAPKIEPAAPAQDPTAVPGGSADAGLRPGSLDGGGRGLIANPNNFDALGNPGGSPFDGGELSSTNPSPRANRRTNASRPELDVAEAELKLAAAEFQIAQAKLKRNTELFEQKLITQEQCEQAVKELAMAQAKLSVAQARVKSLSGQNRSVLPSGSPAEAPQPRGERRTYAGQNPGITTPTEAAREPQGRQRLRETDLAIALRQYEKVKMDAFEARLQRELMDSNSLEPAERDKREDALERRLILLEKHAEELRKSILDFDRAAGGLGR
jgi:beta-lactamase regulating signal transducer with metallopeptidase domain